ncbi:MAG: hypothetical protein K6G73_11590 [Marinilabiliaceae bacterium]|nr:hypothetical protein [Marinilabiliaceae bacterium]
MKINNEDIARMARSLRDESNEQQNIAPWSQKRHTRFPAWIITIPAAIMIGFFFGVWTDSHLKSTAPMTALVDTVYIRVNDTPTTLDTAQAIKLPQATPIAAPTKKSKTVAPNRHTAQPMVSDKIRYDLLVMD